MEIFLIPKKNIFIVKTIKTAFLLENKKRKEYIYIYIIYPIFPSFLKFVSLIYTLLFSFIHYKANVRSLTFSTDGKYLVTESKNTIKLIDI